MEIIILGIESSCDDTSAAVIRDGILLSSAIAGQEIHSAYGGVVPELASRAHQTNIIPVVDKVLRDAGLAPSQLSAIAFTRGPGLLGSLLVGTSFAKGLSVSNDIPLIDVHHLRGHVLSHFISLPDKEPDHPGFPHLCLLISGGHTEIILVHSPHEMEVIGMTIDDAAGEAFDKCAKVMGLPYPGGPEIDKLARQGNAEKFPFARPRIPDLDFSFSGLKTSFLYFLRDEMKVNPQFIQENLNDLCASLQHTITEILISKTEEAVRKTRIKTITLAGGVSANSYIRNRFTAKAEEKNWKVYLPPPAFTTDNAAMIAIAGYYKYLNNEFCGHETTPDARFNL